MTKEELIELSDLNREDNIKYISSEAQGIAITLDSDRYAPTLCKLERAYICGRRKSEEQIAQLKEENAKLKTRNGELAGKVASLERWFGEAKAIIREYVNWDYGDHTNCLPDITKKAEAFLKECK